MKKTYSPDLLSAKKEDIYYTLTMFPYPSGYGLHVGHASVFTINDVMARYQRMKGKTVLNPFGFDSFGLPTENFAMQQGKPAWQVTQENIKFFLSQIEALDMSFDLERIFATSDPEYYKWTQWIFAELYRAGLVYRAEKFVNRCPGCQTVLANDQVVEGLCERCKSEIIQKKHPQWFIKITDYAEKLLADLDLVDWPEETKLAQKNWIGKSVGCEVDFKVTLPSPPTPLPNASLGEGSDISITCFTTRIDTLYGVTAVVLAPENMLLDEYLSDENKAKVLSYRKEAMAKTAVQRQQDTKEKSGVCSGIFAIHPLTGVQIPVWFADYVLMDYGTGAVMFVPAHDERDWEFAEKHGLELKQVIQDITKNLDNQDDTFPSPSEDDVGTFGRGQGGGGETQEGGNYKYKNFMYHTTQEYHDKLLTYAKELRQGATNGEEFLRETLRDRQYRDMKWRRQHPMGTYIADFYCDEHKIVIEIDGPQHEQQKEYDTKRDSYMQELGVSVIRITNDKLYMEPGYVFEKIDEVVNTLTLDPSYIPHPNPLPTTPRTSSLGEGAGTSKDEVCYTGQGILINSAQFSGLDNIEAKTSITTHLESLGLGKAKITYRLRDWSVSRQRYWGSPIPVYYDEQHTPHLVPNSELPVVLPRDIENYKPKGKSPLEDHATFPYYTPNSYKVPYFKYSNGVVAVREDKETQARNRVLAIIQNTETKKYLCIRYTKNKGLSCPTGGIDNGETMVETVRREVFEETGITNLEGLRNIGFEFQTYFYAPWREVNYYAHTNVWMAETTQTEFGTLDPEESKIQTPIWMSLDEIEAEIETGKDNPEMNGYPVMNRVVDILRCRKRENLPMVDKINEFTKELFDKKTKILLIHGRGNKQGDGSCLDALASDYQEKGYEIIYPQLSYADDYDFEKAMNDLLKYDADIVIGHSAGGYLAMQYASRKDISQLICIAPTLSFDEKESDFNKATIDWLGVESAKKYDKFHGQEIANLKTVSVTCIFGGKDDNIPLHFSEKCKNLFPNTKVSILTDRGHMGSGEEHKDFGDLIALLQIEDRKNSIPTFRRECDTLDTFMCSSFYFLRFPDAHNPNELIRKALAEKMFPVDLYTGGKEHTVGHLLYSRFIHKFLYDQGYVNCPEPFAKLVHQGMILGSDGRKMGKRYGNVIDPLDVVASYGSDAVRTYLMFMGPVEQEKIWNDNALKGIKKFLDRIERACLEPKILSLPDGYEKIQKSLESLLHKTIKTLSEDMEKMKYNTSVSKLMILLNAIEDAGSLVLRETLEIYLHLLAPFAPKIAQAIREKFGYQDDITERSRPQFDAEKALDDEIVIPVQINGKRRLELVVSADADEAMLMDAFRGTEEFGRYIGEQSIKKVIYVKGKILNIVL